MVSDMLEQMNRRQLEATAKELKIPAGRYPTKVKLIEAIRKKRANPAKVKRLKLPCPHAGCEFLAMVQVVIDPKRQDAIDKRANELLHDEVERQHKAGEHDRR